MAMDLTELRRSGTEFLCVMPPGDGPWRLKSYAGRVYAASPSAGLFWLEIVIDTFADRGWRAQWVQVISTMDGAVAVHVRDVPKGDPA